MASRAWISKTSRKWCREFAFCRTEIHDEKRSGRPSTCTEWVAKVEETMRNDRRVSLDDLCVSIPQVSRTTIYRILTVSCNIGRCAQHGSYEFWQKTTSGNEWTLPVNFSSAMQTKRITFWIRLSRATKPGRTTSHLRRNNKHVNGCIPLRLSRENLRSTICP